MTNIRNALMQAAGTAASGDPVYVEDVFSAFLYKGTGSSQGIDNNIDLDDKGGLVWIKNRDTTDSHILTDTTRGVTKYLSSDSFNGETTDADTLTSFDSDGFTIGADDKVNTNTENYASWSFAKQEGFFDIVTYTGDGNTSKTINHNLGCKPGMIIIKMTTTNGYKWRVWHKSVASSSGANYALSLSTTSAADNGASTGGFWNSTAPTSTQFTVGNYGQVNNNGDTFVAYLFADGDESDAQIFGDDGDQAIVKTGTVTTGSGGDLSVTLGFEPQWVIIKTSEAVGGWYIMDTMRGFVSSSVSSGTESLLANSNDVEGGISNWGVNATGFTGAYGGESGIVIVYIAIRRGPMKEPSAGTDVFMADRAPNTSPAFVSGFPVDFGYALQGTAGGGTTYFTTRLTDTKLLNPASTAAAANNNNYTFDFQNGMYNFTSYANAGGTLYTIGHMWRRYPKVFDVAVVNSTNSSAANYPHNLGVAPEFFIAKRIDGTGGWVLDQVDYYLLMSTGANLGSEYVLFENLTATTYGAKSGTFSNGETHLVLMFASLDGISKVGTYTGTGNDINVTGLNAPARFVMIKRTDNTGDWYIFDSVEQGIVAGNDTFQYWNTSGSAATTDQDYIDPHSSGFTITSSAPAALNASGGTYRYLAFA